MPIDLSQIITREQREAEALAAAWSALRTERDRLLAESDWTMMPDVDPPGGQVAWTAYRQALRDLPESTEDPAQVVWPGIPISN